MKKNKLYLILTILILVFFTAISANCCEEVNEKLKVAAKEVGNEVLKTAKAVEEVLQGENTEDKEAIQVTEEEKTKEGSEQSENVNNLQENEEQDLFKLITLKGSVQIRSIMENRLVLISITIDEEKNKVEGEATLNWEEEIEVSGEGGESHHSHNYICRIELKGNILGTIKKVEENKYYISATLAGFLTSNYGFDSGSSEHSLEVCDFCIKEFDGKSSNFTITGNYWDNTKKAEGEIMPKDWYWTAAQ